MGLRDGIKVVIGIDNIFIKESLFLISVVSKNWFVGMILNSVDV